MSILDEILDLLSDGRMMKAHEISVALGKDPALVEGALAFLLEYGFIRQGADGRYALDEALKRVLSIQS